MSAQSPTDTHWDCFCHFADEETKAQVQWWWLTPVIPATQEAEIRRIRVRSQTGQIL
jgi:hypothetical protein